MQPELLAVSTSAASSEAATPQQISLPEGLPAYSFSRAAGTEQTRALFLGNCGPGLGHSLESVHAVFSPFQDTCAVVAPTPQSSFCFVLFNSVAQAAAAHAAAPSMQGKALVLRFAHAVLQV